MCNVLTGVTNQLLPAGQAVCSAGMMQLNSAFNGRLPTHTALQVEVVLTLLSCREGDHYWEPAGVAFRTFRE